MQPRLWLASAAAVTLVAGGVYVASPTLHGQAAPQAPAAGADRTHEKREGEDLSRDVQQAVDEAMAQSGLRDGRLSVEVQQAVAEATRQAHEAVRDLDIDLVVDDAMQGVTALVGGRPRLGVSTRDLSAEEAKAAGLTGIAGAWISEVAPDSAAAKAGLQSNDIIVSIDGENVRSVRHLMRLVSETPDGRALQIGYVRGNAKQTVTVTPEAPSRTRSLPRLGGSDEGPLARRFERRRGPDARAFEFVVPPGGPGPRGEAQDFFFRRGPEGGTRVWIGSRARLGVMAQPLTEQLATYFGVKDGVLVTQVTESSPAAKAGIKAGDVITAVNGKPVKDTGDISDHLQGVEAGKTATVELTRDRKSQTVTVTIETPANTSGDRPATRRMRFTA